MRRPKRALIRNLLPLQILLTRLRHRHIARIDTEPILLRRRA